MKVIYALLIPPLAFIVMLALSFGLSGLSSLVAAKGTAAAGKERAYACGQNIEDNRIQPDYNEFFPIAFFFTIMHVAALIITTAPAGQWNTAAQWIPAALFMAVAVLSIRVLFRRSEDVSD
jgi:NADH:ubiquinone oxidoreductase subunit 3 (subunit A)